MELSRLIVGILIVGVALGALFISLDWDKIIDEEGAKQAETVKRQAATGKADAHYPIPRTITSADGRPLKGLVIGKLGGKIVVRRTSDGREFDLQASNLSPEDASWSATLPDGGAKAANPRRLKATWHTSLGRARSEAEKRGVPIFVLFDGSDW